ncbi:hypothetical protein ACFE04_018354 [Oxalis oulophora]
MSTLEYFKEYVVVSILSNISVGSFSMSSVMTSSVHDGIYYLKARFHYNKDQFADLMVITGIAETISQLLLMPTLAPVIREERLLAIGLLFSCVHMFLYGFAWSAWVPYVAAMFSILYGFAQPCLRSIVSKQVGSCEQGKVQGFISGICSLANVISPLIFSPLTALFLSEKAPFNFPGFSIVCIGFAAVRFKAVGVILLYLLTLSQAAIVAFFSILADSGLHASMTFNKNGSNSTIIEHKVGVRIGYVYYGRTIALSLGPSPISKLLLIVILTSHPHHLQSSSPDQNQAPNPITILINSNNQILTILIRVKPSSSESNHHHHPHRSQTKSHHHPYQSQTILTILIRVKPSSPSSSESNQIPSPSLPF